MVRSIQFLFGQFVPQCNHNIDKHFDDYFVLQYMEGGEIESGDRRAILPDAGPMVLVEFSRPTNQLSRLRPQQYLDSSLSGIPGTGGEGVEGRRAISDSTPTTVPTIDYSDRFDDLLELSRRTDRWSIARASLLLETILTELAEARAKPQSVPGWLENGLAQITALGAEIDYDRWRWKRECHPEPSAGGLRLPWPHHPRPTPSPAGSVMRGKCSERPNFR